MRVSFMGRALVVVVMYIVVFVGLVVIQYPLGGPFSHNIGGLQFRGRYYSDESSLESVELGAHGIFFVFSADKPLVYRSAAGREVSLVPTGYQQLADGFSVDFNDGSRISAFIDAEGNVSWAADPSERVSSLKMAYRLNRNVSISLDDSADHILIKSGGSEWVLSNLQNAAEADRVEMLINLGRPLPVSLLARDEESVQSIVQVLPEPRSQAEWSALLMGWQDKAWRALSSQRFNSARTEWLDVNANLAYSNQAFMMHMAELMRRGQAEAAAELVSAVRSRHLAAVDWQASAFAGNVAATMQEREATDRQRLAELETGLQARQMELLYQADLLPLVFDRGSPQLARDLLAFASAQDFNTASLAGLVTVLGHFFEGRNYLADNDNPFARGLQYADRLLDEMRLVEDSFVLLADGQETVDSRLSISAARVLLKLADYLDKPLYASAGQSLLASLLAQADDHGAVPAFLTLRGNRLHPATKKLAAEELYPLVAESPHYPRAVSFYRSLGPGIWMWTANPSFTASRSGADLVFTASYPVGSYHFAALYGISPFRNVQLYNINYNMDASFERYNASGYFYKRSDAVLYLKMSHRSTEESLRLMY